MKAVNLGYPAGYKTGHFVPLEVLRRDLQRYVSFVVDNESRQEVSAFLASTENQAPDAIPDEKTLNEFKRVCVRAGLHLLLTTHGIAHPTYNYFEEFPPRVEAQGPWDSVPATWQASTPPIWRLLGSDVSFPVGVPASVLTATADWIQYYARRGFNVLTYKTVRSAPRDAHANPNWVFLKDLNEPLDPGQTPETCGNTLVWPSDPNAFSMANSFGVPSFAPEVWQRDVSKAVACLRSGQLLIVSVMGSWEDFKGPDLIKDFVNVARMAKAADAPAIELNLSCPNTIDPDTGKVKQNLICESAKDTAEIVQAVRNVIGDVPLVIKLAYMPRERLEEVVVPLVEASLIQAVSGINTVQMTVRRDDGNPAFPGTANNPEARLKAGVSGVAIRNYGLQFVRWLNEIRAQRALKFDIIGMGGVMNADDVDAYRRAGAEAVQTATAAFFNPDLPKQIFEKFGGAPVQEAQLEARGAVLELLATQGPKPLREIADEVVSKFFPPERSLLENTQAILNYLESQGWVTWERKEGKSVFRLEQQSEEQLQPTL